MSHQTPSDYMHTNSIIQKIFKRRRSNNYTFNHGELVDALYEKLHELHTARRCHLQSDNIKMMHYLQGKINGMEETISMLFEQVEEKKGDTK